MLLAMMRSWYRDVNVCKAGGRERFSSIVRKQAERYKFTDFPRIFEAIE